MVNDLNEMIGARILVAVTYLNDDGEVDERFQFVGHVREVATLVSIERPGSEPFTLPPAPEAYERSPSGQYALRETGEVVDDVGYVISWTVDRGEPPGTGVP